MDLNEMNENWQKDAPKLAAVEKTNPFTVPDGYFKEMEEQLLSRIKITQFDNGQPLFTVPDGYFEQLSENISSLAKLEQLKTDEPSEVYPVPENYFATLEDRIKAKLQPQEAVEQPNPKVRKLFASWATFAAAACITAVIGIGIYVNNNQNKDIEAQIAEIPAEEIVDYLQLYSDAGDAPVIVESIEDESELSKLGPELSEQEIEQYLKLNL